MQREFEPVLRRALHLELRIEELENALRYYGNSDNYELTHDPACIGGVSASIEYDQGQRARKALYGE